MMMEEEVRVRERRGVTLVVVCQVPLVTCPAAAGHAWLCTLLPIDMLGVY